MELRYWLIIVCVFAIVLIFLDAMRRKNGRARYQGDYTNDIDELSDYPSAELPGGAVKVRVQTAEELAALESKLMLENNVPLLLDSVLENENEEEDLEDDTLPFEMQHELDFDAIFTAHIEETPERMEFAAQAQQAERDARAEEDFYSEEPDPFDDLQDELWQPIDAGAQQHGPESVETESVDLFASAPPGQDLTESEEVIVINVLSRDGTDFNNETLMELALACGMRFGAMNIFHRTDDVGRLQFSMANVTKPGTFDIDDFNQMSIRGIALFMTLPCSSDPLQSFEYMSETASVISRHLNGVIKDEMHNRMSEQSFEHCRDRIREFSRGQLLD